MKMTTYTIRPTLVLRQGKITTGQYERLVDQQLTALWLAKRVGR